MSTETTTIPGICGTPTGLTVSSNNDNTFTVSCIVGTDGTSATAKGVRLYITCDGTTPSSDNYNYTYDLLGAAANKLTKVISFAALSQKTIETWLGADCVGNIKVKALTLGLGGYDSTLTNEVSTTFTWYGITKPPIILTPSLVGETIGLLSNYRVSWSTGDSGINNPIVNYSLSVYDVTDAKTVASFTTSNLFYVIAANILTPGHSYIFYVTANGTISGFNGQAASSGLLTTKTVDKFPNIVLQIQDGNTVPSTDILDQKTYVDIGSGTVARLFWNAPTATGNIVDYYKLTIKQYDRDTDSYYTVFEDNINNVNEFYINSSLLSQIELPRYQLKVFLTARSLYGSIYDSDSNTLTLNISRGCGLYVKDNTLYPQPVMKRAIAFVLVPGQGNTMVYRALADADGRLLTDVNDRQLYVKVSELTRSVENYSWDIMQEFYFKNASEKWCLGDISYEVLTDASGEIIVDLNNDPIYVL